MIPRLLNLTEILEFSQSAFIFGPRGTGKSVLSRAYLKGAPHSMTIDLLKSDEYLRLLHEPWRIRSEIQEQMKHVEIMVVLIDEVQKIPLLLDEVHWCIEQYPQRLSFVLTGSSARKLKRQQANMLAGRARRLHLHPLSQMEVELDLDEALTRGTLPVLLAAKGGWNKVPGSLLSAYVETYLKEEIIQEAVVRKVDVFSRFLELAAQMNGEPINFTRVGRNCKVTTKTAQEYFEILTDTMLATRVDGWSESVTKQLLQQPKFYFFDCGVLNALTGDLRSQLKSSSFRYGRLFETWLLQEMIRASDYLGLGLRFNYWKTSQGQEVDFVVSRTFHKPLAALEVKSGDTPDSTDFSGLRAFSSEYPDVPQFCLCRTPRAYRVGDVTVVPWQEAPRILAAL